MGWFGRKDDDDDGLYRGDAPVFAPGTGDDAPSAYVAGGSGSATRPDAPLRPPTPAQPPDPPAFGPQGSPPDQWSAPPQPWSAPDQWTPPPAGQWNPPPGQWTPPPEQWTQAPAHWTPPAPAAGPAVVTVRRSRGPGAGCGLITLVVILGVVGLVAFGIFRTVRSVLPERTVPQTQVGAVDTPVTVTYDDAELRLTVSGVQAQPGGAWDRDSGQPTVLVAMSVERTDDGSSSVHVPFIDWQFAPTDAGAPIDVDIVSGFEPDLTSITLGAGDSVRGYLAFNTAATVGRLQLDGDLYGDPPLVVWDLTATPAAPVTGAVGTPVQPQIGLPPFTVTLDSTTWADQAQAGAWQAPASGSFLVAGLTVTSTGGDGSAWIENQSFVFVPTSGPEVPVAAPQVVSSAQSFATVSAGGSAPLQAVFDAAVAPGSLEMRDAAGRTMVSWSIA